MTGRNAHPKRNGRQASPSRLDQYGETLANDNDLTDLSVEQQIAVEGGGDEEGPCNNEDR